MVRIDTTIHDDFERVIRFCLDRGVRIISKDSVKRIVFAEMSQELANQMREEINFKDVVSVGKAPLGSASGDGDINEKYKAAMRSMFDAIQSRHDEGKHDVCCGEIFSQLEVLLEASDPMVTAALREIAHEIDDKTVKVLLRAVANEIALGSVPPRAI
ncbi:MAG: hypothetical protein ABII13_03795 [Patescibacteria group bacterium]|nr:hypothetical protein [Patescibacteria group bacterium]MBU2509362.1 hypothetical protein [Patescibacteria group bacterium]